MKRSRRAIPIVVATIGLAGTPAAAKIYRVSPSGDDGCSCRSAGRGRGGALRSVLSLLLG